MSKDFVNHLRTFYFLNDEINGNHKNINNLPLGVFDPLNMAFED